MRLFMRALLVILGAALAGISADAAAQTAPPIKLRASLDTTMTHGRTISVDDYLKQLQEASGGRIETQLFHSGQLYKDANVAKALRQGEVEMAAPGTWVLTGFVGDADIFQLPVMFGRTLDEVHRIVDGPIGQKIDEEMEQKIGVKILGPWLDLGYENLYSTTKPVADFKDIAGLKLRNPGGAGLFARAQFFGATPNMTAWPDVPLALSQGTFDALISSNESLVSAKLWDSGVRYAFEDHEFVAEYVPMVSQTFWKKLTPDLQTLMIDLWAKNIPAYRARMAKAQTEARGTLAEHGIKFTDPSPEQLSAVRQKMMATQDAIIGQLKITPAIAKDTTAALAATN
ncbi:MAG: TRAP transporter substrate-binding protein DctP [Alphaproteobacteria bacterium]|nr:TRAP transporter substrate-binding protein DctP [Alphaproteobacteria bacterium]